MKDPTLSELNSVFREAEWMHAVGMRERAEISKVIERLEMLRVPTPRPAAAQVAVKLHASAMHIDEIYAAQGTSLGRFFGPKNLSPENPYLLGSSVSGTVVAKGMGADRFAVGDAVIAIPNEMGDIGSWADYRCIDQKWLMPKPEALSHVEAAAVTMAACVAWAAVEAAKVESGSQCVVVGASGSIGVMILQFLKSQGCVVTAVCSRAKEGFVRAKGADAVIDYTEHAFGRHLSEHGEAQDAVFDCVGGREIEASGIEALKRTGIFVTVVGPQQYIGERRLSWWEVGKVLAYIGRRVVMSRIRGPRYSFGAKYPRLIVAAAMRQVVECGIRMPVDGVIPFELESITTAVRHLTTHRANGRIVIDFSSDTQTGNES